LPLIKKAGYFAQMNDLFTQKSGKETPIFGSKSKGIGIVSR
jgi:hypothetical protein